MTGVNVSLNVNLDGLIAALVKSGADVAMVAAQAINEEAQIAFEKSQDLVPVDTGVLRASGVLETAAIQGDKIVVEMGYGGAAKEYALIVHERLDVNHASPTQAKYLEQPALEAQATLGPRILQRLEDKIAGLIP